MRVIVEKLVEWRLAGETEVLGENLPQRTLSAPAPLCPPQIPHDETQARTRAAAVGSQRLTAWAMARPFHLPSLDWNILLRVLFSTASQSCNTLVFFYFLQWRVLAPHQIPSLMITRGHLSAILYSVCPHFSFISDCEGRLHYPWIKMTERLNLRTYLRHSLLKYLRLCDHHWSNLTISSVIFSQFIRTVSPKAFHSPTTEVHSKQWSQI
jgi:hypothetical protein